MRSVILLSDHTDFSTSYVSEWISYMGYSFLRSNDHNTGKQDSESCFLLDNDLSESTFLTESDRIVDSKSIHSIWVRKIPRTSFTEKLRGLIKQKSGNVLFSHLVDEAIGSQDAHFTVWEDKKLFGSFNRDYDKYTMLRTARKCGLRIPATLITSSKKKLKVFFQKYKFIITKSIKNARSYDVNRHSYMMYTTKIDNQKMEEISDTFFPSLFQEYIEKEIEVRIFYLDGTCHSMAIFSQMDKETSVDFRYYTNNRMVPYNLPPEVEKKVDNFMKHMGLNTGSLDIIKTPDKEYVFLEVNPQGQFGMVSKPCNYFLEKEIAKFLVS